jgi:hypothetical protein
MTINSAPYASFEERKEWITTTASKISREVRIPHPLLVEVKLSEQEVIDLQNLALRFIAHSSSISADARAPEILKRLEEANQFKPDLNAHHLLIPLEQRVSQILHSMAFHQSTLALEYPVNLRVVHGKPIEGYSKKDYATTNIHSDIWAGEPADTLQVLIPLLGDVHSTFCQWYETDAENFDVYLSNLATYSSAQTELGDARAISHTFEIGTLYFFDSALPHQTIQKGGQLRVSLDFRLRRLFPYADPQWAPRMHRKRGAYGRYFLFPPEPYPYSSFEQKLDHEIEILEKLGMVKFAELRKAEYP